MQRTYSRFNEWRKQVIIQAAERGVIPDWVLRAGMRSTDRRLAGSLAKQSEVEQQRLFEQLHAGPMVIGSEAANQQHYELPAEFFMAFMDRHMKYSSCYWPEGVADLGAAEEASLQQTVDRAGIEDGMAILELGFGWGSFSLYVAERFPNSRVVGISNSSIQRELILARADARGIENLEIRTANVTDLSLEQQFDRVVSIEMFEHVRNWRLLLERIAEWLKPGGVLFAHFFVHKNRAYTFDSDAGDWMATHFFTGGLMPSPCYFADSLPEAMVIEQDWHLNGRHYERTLNAWLERYDDNKEIIVPLLAGVYGEDSSIWWQRWRMFFMGCAEFFGLNRGEEWFVYHVRAGKK